MYIHSHGSIVAAPVDDIKQYKQEVARFIELQFRRANRFVLLSLAGACRCVHGQPVPRETAVYLTTENGNLGDTENVLDQIFHHHQFPMPYNFINTMSNTASFYIAQGLNLLGPNLTFSSKLVSFERGLALLIGDLRSGALEAALIGGVDEACGSTEHFEAKFQRPGDPFTMVEGSSWLLLKNSAQAALGEIRAVDTYSDLTQLTDHLEQKRLSGTVVRSFGILVDEAERQAIATALPASVEFDHIAVLGYHDSATASGAAAFLEKYPSGNWLHISKESRGLFVLLHLEKY
jgi:3-oxoacyl-(acyl-carrier-protein) synthase